MRRAARLLRSGPGTMTSPVARWAVTLLAVAGAALLVWSGVIHLQLWSDGYKDISVIGPLFLVQAIASIVLALALVVFRRLALLAAGRSWPPPPPSACCSAPASACSAIPRAWPFRTPNYPWPWSSRPRPCSPPPRPSSWPRRCAGATHDFWLD